MSHITTEQALQLSPQLNQRGGSTDKQTSDKGSQDENQRSILRDDAVTLLMRQNLTSVKKIQVESFKGEVGQEKTFIKETLKSKLAEYNLNPHTQLSVSKDMFGRIEIKGAIPEGLHEKISLDLNNNKMFKAAFDKLSKEEPTLNYVDNVVKLSKVYGVENSLFNSLISEQKEFNRLNDIAHRYEALKQTNPAASDNSGLSESHPHFNFVLNA